MQGGDQLSDKSIDIASNGGYYIHATTIQLREVEQRLMTELHQHAYSLPQ